MSSIMYKIKSLQPLLIFFIFEPPYLALNNQITPSGVKRIHVAVWPGIRLHVVEWPLVTMWVTCACLLWLEH